MARCAIPHPRVRRADLPPLRCAPLAGSAVGLTIDRTCRTHAMRAPATNGCADDDDVRALRDERDAVGRQRSDSSRHR